MTIEEYKRLPEYSNRDRRLGVKFAFRHDGISYIIEWKDGEQFSLTRVIFDD